MWKDSIIEVVDLMNYLLRILFNKVVFIFYV